MGLVGADKIKSRKYYLMVSGSSPAANVLVILVLTYRVFVTSVKILKNYTRKYMKRMSTSSHSDG